jgi:hypothetical protein
MKLNPKLIIIGCASVIMTSCATEPPTVYKTKTTVYVQDTKTEKNKVIEVKKGETVVIPNTYFIP